MSLNSTILKSHSSALKLRLQSEKNTYMFYLPWFIIIGFIIQILYFTHLVPWSKFPPIQHQLSSLPVSKGVWIAVNENQVSFSERETILFTEQESGQFDKKLQSVLKKQIANDLYLASLNLELIHAPITLILHVHPKTKYQKIKHIIHLATLAGYNNFEFATRKSIEE